jgi:hypothetical protein
MPIYMNGKAAGASGGNSPDKPASEGVNQVELQNLLAMLLNQAGQGGLTPSGKKALSNEELDVMSENETIKALAMAAGTVEGVPKLNSDIGKKVVVNASDKKDTLDLLKDL